MKKYILSLMIACLSLFAYPFHVNAGTIAPAAKTELPVVPPSMEKKVNEFKKKHPDMFSKKDNKETGESKSADANKAMGGVGIYISGGALLVIIILLILFL